jgi:hypothetical protein
MKPRIGRIERKLLNSNFKDKENKKQKESKENIRKKSKYGNNKKLIY